MGRSSMNCVTLAIDSRQSPPPYHLEVLHPLRMTCVLARDVKLVSVRNVHYPMNTVIIPIEMSVIARSEQIEVRAERDFSLP